MNTEQYTPSVDATQILAKPAFSFDEFWLGILGVPGSTAEEISKGPDAPKFFLIGRRRYIRQQDALAWIDHMADAKPYYPRRNNRTNGKGA